MTFDKVNNFIDFPAQEREILSFWEKTRAFEKLCEKNKGKEPWSFLDGPMTANNPMGVHHAWGRTYKDVFQRYYAMNGRQLRYQNGYDCQGLWVEVEVEKDLKLKSKTDIENLVPGDKFASIDKFSQACRSRVDTFAKKINEQSIRLGYWMDWDREEDWSKSTDDRRSYFTNSEENNYTIWGFLKKCHDRKLVYKAFDAMPWCPRCAVGISQMEMHEGYKYVAHQAIFVKFPLRERPGENLLVWTTTPWTLTSNIAVAVNPDLTYVKVKFQDEIFYLAKGALTTKRLEEDFKKGNWPKGVQPLKSLAQIFKEKGGFETIGEIKGKEMLGWTYHGPFDELPAQDEKYGYPKELAKVANAKKWSEAISPRQVHRIISWEGVGETEGTGLVHSAPGCGKEDFELGKKEKLPPIAPLNEEGFFLNEFGFLAGKAAYEEETVKLILANLKEKKILVASEAYPHNYPHCWRCKTQLLFRLVDEWYIDMSWREEIKKNCYDITWIPDFGLKRELDWLSNMGDWMISKKRYWGLALPIWVCEKCDNFEVIGGRNELREKALEGWDKFEGHTPHRPWVDMVKIKCPHCGGRASRISDVGNPWLDAGIVPYSTIRYNSDKSYWKKWFPAELVTESFPGQFRNWFYALLAMSTMLEKKAPFKVLLGHAQVKDEKGEEMHKSKGNAIPFDEAAEKMGADLIRWYFCRANPASNINFGYTIADDIRNKFLLKLWNTYTFFTNYARLDKFDPNAPRVPEKERPDIDRWILSDLQLLTKTARQEFEKYNISSFCMAMERFIDDKLSNWYVRRNRRRFWKSEESKDKLAAYQTLYEVLTTLTKLLAPFVPFVAESMYQNLEVRSGSKNHEESVHHCQFPTVKKNLIDEELSSEMEALLKLVTMGAAARNIVKIKTRQPLAELKVQTKNLHEIKAIERFGDQITEELNLKKITLLNESQSSLIKYRLKPDFKALGPKLGPKLPAFQEMLSSPDSRKLVPLLLSQSEIEIELAGEKIMIESSHLFVETESPEGYQSVAERGTIVCLDIAITPALKREGLAREVVRHIQNLRKTANLELEDRIELFLQTTDQELLKSLQEHKQYIMSETLTFVWSDKNLKENSHGVEVKLEEKFLKIELRKYG